jgi:hypothetical protein
MAIAKLNRDGRDSLRSILKYLVTGLLTLLGQGRPTLYLRFELLARCARLNNKSLHIRHEVRIFSSLAQSFQKGLDLREDREHLPRKLRFEKGFLAKVPSSTKEVAIPQ